MRKKDRLINAHEFLPDGRVVRSARPYRVHVCAVGTMAEVVAEPFPDDPPAPPGTPDAAFDGCVRGPVSGAWLVDNPGRQQIGS